MPFIVSPDERISVPDGYRIFLKSGKVAPGIPARGIAVVILPPGIRSVMEAMTGDAKFHAAVIHDRGSIWPDKFGRQLVEAALSRGGAAILQFQCAADARQCRDLLKAIADEAAR